MSNEPDAKAQQADVNVVVRSRQDLPFNAIIVLVIAGAAFYGGFKLGGISLQTLLDASNAANQSYKTRVRYQFLLILSKTGI